MNNKEQVSAIQRYKIGYHTDEWGMRSGTPAGIHDASGSWVRYSDHVAVIAALRAQQVRDMLVNGGALKLVLNVLRRAGKHEVADELEATAQAASESMLEDTTRYFFDAGWKACANFCNRDDVRFDGIVGQYGCPQFEAAFRTARKERP